MELTEPIPAKRPNLLRRLYAWTLSWSDRPNALRALFGISLIESSIFPIPPDPLLMAMTFGQPKRWFRFAFWCSLGSVIGAVVGWAIGLLLWEIVGDFFFRYVPKFTPEVFEKANMYFDQNAFLWLTASAFTPIPFKVFTIAAGVFKVSLPVLIVASIIGRSARFFLVAGVIRVFGPRIRPILEKYLELATILLFILGVLGFLAIDWLKG
jgi:membrane protein YqaA with SNARE-associated domain